jgi:hypothetical protein
MDWLWPLYEVHVLRLIQGGREAHQAEIGEAFLRVLSESRATLYGMLPVGDGIRFKGLGRWSVPEVPALLADPNGFIADHFGGGKFKLNFHHGPSFVCTHNFRTWGEPRWESTAEFALDD